MTQVQEHMNQVQQRLQETDIWIGFVNETNPAIPTSTEVWQIKNIAVYIKTYLNTQKELDELLRYLYLETHKGHRLHIAVHHPPEQVFVNKNKRSYSSHFFDGVHYCSSPDQVKEYLAPFEQIQTIDLADWSFNQETLDKLFTVISNEKEERGYNPQARLSEILV